MAYRATFTKNYRAGCFGSRPRTSAPEKPPRLRAWLAGEHPEVAHALSVLERSIAWPAQVPP